MKNHKFTKGPWKVHPSHGFLIMGEEATTCGPADLSPDSASYEEAVANVRLVASAPELLEALEEAERWLDAGQSMMPEGSARDKTLEAMRKVREAINKALKGEES